MEEHPVHNLLLLEDAFPEIREGASGTERFPENPDEPGKRINDPKGLCSLQFLRRHMLGFTDTAGSIMQ